MTDGCDSLMNIRKHLPAIANVTYILSEMSKEPGCHVTCAATILNLGALSR